MLVSGKVVGIISFVGVLFMTALSPAIAGDARSNDCRLLPSHNDAESGDERSHSTARALIKYVEKYWDIATSEKPKEVSVSRVDDPSGDGSKLDFYNVQFRTFQAGFYRYPDGTAMPSGLSTTSTKFNLPCGLKVGQTQKKVRAVLGVPTHVQQESFIYGTGGDQNGEVIFTFKRGNLTQVAWAYDTH
jgi:hypothetical protein